MLQFLPKLKYLCSVENNEEWRHLEHQFYGMAASLLSFCQIDEDKTTNAQVVLHLSIQSHQLVLAYIVAAQKAKNVTSKLNP